jgi:hypothetical protein
MLTFLAKYNISIKFSNTFHLNVNRYPLIETHELVE